MNDDDPRHGTRAGYMAGCREDCCRAAAARYERGRQLDKLNGTARTVPITGAVRRVRALQRIGWSAESLSLQLGYSRAWLNVTVCRPGSTRLYRRNHDAIVELYEALAHTPGPSSLTRQRATAAGWPPPDAWFDIDDPDEKPDPGYTARRPHDEIDPVVVERILAGDQATVRTATRAEKFAVVARWTGSQNELERITGWNVNRYAREVA